MLLKITQEDVQEVGLLDLSSDSKLLIKLIPD